MLKKVYSGATTLQECQAKLGQLIRRVQRLKSAYKVYIRELLEYACNTVKPRQPRLCQSRICLSASEFLCTKILVNREMTRYPRFLKKLLKKTAIKVNWTAL